MKHSTPAPRDFQSKAVHFSRASQQPAERFAGDHTVGFAVCRFGKLGLAGLLLLAAALGLVGTTVQAGSRVLHFDSAGGSILDVNGVGTGFTERLPGTGSALPPSDANLLLNTGSGTLQLTTTRSDFNGQVNMNLCEAPGVSLASLGFFGTNDFSVTASFTAINQTAFECIDQLGVFVGTASTNLTRAGIINWDCFPPAENEGFGANTQNGVDLGARFFGTNPGLEMTVQIQRIGGIWSITVNGQDRMPNSINDGSRLPLPPTFLDSETNLIVGVFGANTVNDNPKPVQLDSFSVTVVEAVTPCVPAPTGLVAWWRGENNADDQLGSHDGSLQNGASFAPGKVGSAFSFDGVDDRVEIPDAPGLNPTTAVTLDAWVNPQALTRAYNAVVAKSSESAGQRSYGMWITADGRVHVEPTSLGSSYALSGPGAVTLNTWTHVAAVITAGVGFQIYVNGAEQTITAGGPLPTLSATAAPVTIGNSDMVTRDYWFTGLIDEVDIFDRALSQAEIQAIYAAGAAGKCTQSGPECTSLSDLANNLEGYWPFNGDGEDGSDSNRDLVLEGGVGFAAGLFGQALDLPGNNSMDAVRLAEDAAYNFGSSDFTMQIWVNFNNTSGEQVMIEKFTGSGGPGWTLAKLDGNSLHFYGSSGGNITVGASISANTWNQIVARRTSGTLTLFHNGVALGSTSLGAIPDSTNPLLIGRRNSGDGRDFSLDGRLDEIAIWRRGLSDEDIACLYNSGTGRSIADYLSTCTTPTVTTSPASQAVCSGGAAIFTVAASGTAPFSYQWLKGGNELSGETANTLTISPVSSSDAGMYSVRVSNACGQQTSTAAQLSVDASTLLSQGKPVTGSAYYDQGSEVFPFDNLTDGRFNDTGSPNDWSFWLTPQSQGGWAQIDLGAAYQVDTIRLQNTRNRSYNDRGTANFSIELSTDGVNYVPAVSGTLASVWGLDPIPFESFPIPAQPARFIRFNVLTFYGGSGGLNELEVYGLDCDTPPCISPAVLANPLRQAVCPHAPASFMVQASGTEPLTYQWFKNGEEIVGQTSATLSLPAVQAGDVGDYTVQVANACGNVVSAGAQLTIVDTPPVISQIPAFDTVEACATYTDPGATALDDCDGTILVSDNSATVNTSEPGPYIVTYIATDSSGQTATATRTVLVQDTTPPTFSVVPANKTVTCGGDNQAEITAWLASAAASDTCGSVTVTHQIVWQDVCTATTATVTWTADDGHGNTDTVSKTLTIETDYQLANLTFPNGNVSIPMLSGVQQTVLVPVENTGLCPERIESATVVAGFEKPAITVVSPALPLTVCSGSSATLTLNVDTAGAFDGVYQATLNLTGPGGSSKSVEIEIIVTGQALPDLALNFSGGGLSIVPSVGPNFPAPAESFTVNARIKNLGTLNAGPFQVNFFEGNTPIGSETVTALAQGQTITVPHIVSTGLADEGYYLIRAEIVPPTSGELRLNNNSAASFLQVGTPASGSAIILVEASAEQSCEPDKGEVDVRAHYAITSGGTVFEYPVQGGAVEVDVTAGTTGLPGLRGGHTDREGRYRANLTLLPSQTHTITVRVMDFTLTGQDIEPLFAHPEPECTVFGEPGPDVPFEPTAARDLYLCGDDLQFIDLGGSIRLRATVHYANSHPTLNDEPFDVKVRFIISNLAGDPYYEELPTTIRFQGPAPGVANVDWDVPGNPNQTYLVTVRLEPDIEQYTANDQATRGIKIGTPDPEVTIAFRDLFGGCGDPQWVSGRAVYANDLTLPVICGEVTVHVYADANNNGDLEESTDTLLGTISGFRTDSSGYFNVNLNGLLQAPISFAKVVVTDAGADGLRGEASIPIECGGRSAGGGGGGGGGGGVGGDLFIFSEHIGFLDYESGNCVSLNRPPEVNEQMCILALPHYEDGGAGAVADVPVEINVLVPLTTGNGTLTPFNILPGSGNPPSTFDFPGSGGAVPVSLSPWSPFMAGPQIIQVVINPNNNPLPFADPTGNNAATRLLFVGPQNIVMSAAPAHLTIAGGDMATFTIEAVSLEPATPTLELKTYVATSPDGLTPDLLHDEITLPATTTMSVMTTTATPPGTYEIYVTAAGDGQSAIAMVKVTVLDTTPPQIACPPAVTVQCDADVPLADVGSVGVSDDTDSSPSVTHVGDVVSGGSPKTILRTYRATDAAGNSAECTQTITVHDTTLPVVTLLGAAVMTVECHGTFADPGATASDNCAGDLTASIGVSGAVNVHAPGQYSLTYAVTDPAGNIGSATRTVNVVDTAAPVVALLGGAVITVECHGTFTDPGATANDSCAGSLPVSTSGSVDVNTPGTYLLTYSAADPVGNSGSTTRTVNVVDTTVPVVTLLGAATMTVECHGTFTDPGATANDACAGTLPAISTGAVDVNTPGTYPLTYTATDPAGNAGTVSRTVTVVDTAAPVVTLLGSATMTVECHGTFSDPGATANDACAGLLAVSVTGTVDANTPGTYMLTYSAADPAGNSSATTRTVNVVDTTAPMFACPSPIQLLADANGSVQTPDFLSQITITDNCSATVTGIQSPAAGSALSAGTHPVVITVTDAAGNPSTCTVNVTVTSEANTPPVVTIEQPASGALSPVNQGVQFVGSFTDDGPAGTHTAQWVITSANVPATTIPGNVSGFTVSDQILFPEPGVYSIKLVVTDAQSESGEATKVLNDLPAYVVAYDPNGGFVTGGGFIWSPLGAFHPGLEEFSSFEGKANFGFVSKYKKGAHIPTGQTEFQFHAGGLNFHSGNYQWLVVAGARAQYKGTGTINGAGSYSFMLTAIDGQINGGGGKDRFRIKIWDTGTGVIIYDNQPASDDDAELNDATILWGGSIVIHKK